MASGTSLARLDEVVGPRHPRHALVGDQHRHLVAARAQLAQQLQRLRRPTPRGARGSARRSRAADRGRPPRAPPARRRRRRSRDGARASWSEVSHRASQTNGTEAATRGARRSSSSPDRGGERLRRLQGEKCPAPAPGHREAGEVIAEPIAPFGREERVEVRARGSAWARRCARPAPGCARRGWSRLSRIPRGTRRSTRSGRPAPHSAPRAGLGRGRRARTPGRCGGAPPHRPPDRSPAYPTFSMRVSAGGATGECASR